MAINWDVLVPGPEGLLIPTYGNYGGPGYSDGEVLEDPNQPVDYSEEPVDALDALFLEHDKAYDSLDPEVRADGDVELAKGIADLSDEQLDAEASLYGGFATLFAIYLLVEVNQQAGELTLDEYAHLTRSALQNIEQGLSEASPAELAEIVNWLEESAGVDVESSADIIAEIEQVFDFSQPSSDEVSTFDLAGFLDDSVEFIKGGEAKALVRDLAETGADAIPEDLQNSLQEHYKSLSSHFDWLA